MAFPSSSGVEAHADCLRNHILIKTDSSNFSETNLSSIDEKTCVRKRKRKMERPVQTDVSQNTSSWNHILNIPDPSHLSETLTTSVDLKTCARKIKMKMKSSEQADVDSQNTSLRNHGLIKTDPSHYSDTNPTLVDIKTCARKIKMKMKSPAQADVDSENTSLRNLALIKSNPSHFSETNPTSVDIKTYARKIKMKMRSPIQADVDTQSTSINEIKPNSPDVLTETIKKSSCHCDCSLQITSSFQVKNEPVERVELESQGSLNSGMDHQVINSEAENTTLKLSFSPSSIKTEQLSTNSDHNCVTFPQPVQVKNEPLERVELESEGSLNSSTDHQENTTLKLSFSTSSIKTEQLSTNSDHNFMTFPQPIQVKTECIETGLPAVDEADITSSPQPIGKLELFELSEEGTVPTPSPIQGIIDQRIQEILASPHDFSQNLRHFLRQGSTPEEAHQAHLKGLAILTLFGVVPTREQLVMCAVCDEQMSASPDKRRPLGWRYRCRNCHCRIEPTAGTFLQRARLADIGADGIVKLMHSFCCKLITAAASSDIGVNKETVLSHYSACRDVVRTNAWHNLGVVGGTGDVVEVGETMLFKRKTRQGRLCREELWLFGACSRTTGKVFGTLIPDRQADTLFPLMKKYIHKDSWVVSGSFRSYRRCARYFRGHGTVNLRRESIYPCLEEDPMWFPQGFFNKECVDKHFNGPAPHPNPPFNECLNPIRWHTQQVESGWLDLKTVMKKCRDAADLYVGEWMWRTNEAQGINDRDTFVAFMRATAKVYPGPFKTRQISDMDLCQCEDCLRR